MRTPLFTQRWSAGLSSSVSLRETRSTPLQTRTNSRRARVSRSSLLLARAGSSASASTNGTRRPKSGNSRLFRRKSTRFRTITALYRRHKNNVFPTCRTRLVFWDVSQGALSQANSSTTDAKPETTSNATHFPYPCGLFPTSYRGIVRAPHQARRKHGPTFRKLSRTT